VMMVMMIVRHCFNLKHKGNSKFSATGLQQ